MRYQLVVLLIAAGALSLGGSCSGLVVDRSMNAVYAGDYTLVVSACGGTPGRGMDICRVKENAPISSSWQLIVPQTKSRRVKGGELTVYYRDISKTYAITGPVVQIPWKDFFGAPNWSRDMDGEAMALAEIRYVTDQGIEEIWRARGIAKIVVTRQGYDPLPIDSGFTAWGMTCKISYSTAGRSDVKCH